MDNHLRKKTAKWIRKTERKRREMRLEAKADFKEAQNRLKGNFRSVTWWYSVVRLAVVTLLYFSASVALTFYQKDLIKSIPFPLTMVICHLVIKYILAQIGRAILTRFSTSGDSSSRLPARNRRLDSVTGSDNDDRIILDWNVYLWRVTPVAAAAAWDIGLSQWSLKYVTVALYTMTKTTCILFIMVLSIVFKLERKHWSQIIIVAFISVGIGLFTHKSTSFSLVGFVMALTSSAMCGLRWTLSQKVMQKSELGLQNPIDMIYHVQPLMILSILPLAIGIEGIDLASSMYGFRFHSYGEVMVTTGLVVGGGCLAFFMEVFEYLIVNIGSSLTLAIIGVSKEIVTVSVSLVRTHTELSPINSVGMAVCLAGIVAHVIRKSLVVSSTPKPENGFEMGDYHLSSSSDEDIPRSRRRKVEQQRGRGDVNIPLLIDEDWTSSDDDDDGASGGVRTKKQWSRVNDEFFLSENRTWTTIKDSHLQAATSSLDASNQSQQSLSKEVNLSSD